MHLFSINPYTIFHELTISSPYPQNLEKWATISHENSIMTNDKVTKSTTFKKSSFLKVVETTQEDLGTQKFYANVCMTERIFFLTIFSHDFDCFEVHQSFLVKFLSKTLNDFFCNHNKIENHWSSRPKVIKENLKISSSWVEFGKTAQGDEKTILLANFLFGGRAKKLNSCIVGLNGFCLLAKSRWFS